MKTFLFIFLAGYAVRCDDSNYYVVQMPDNDEPPPKEFRVYWNSPTIQCKSKRVLFNDLYEKYGILQNEGDTFRGDKISILYDPGEFPALLKNSSSGEIKYRNGGVPQEGDLIKHLNTFQKVLEQSIPDKGFNGVGIIDFESWRPVLRQNFGILTPYKSVSYEIEKKRHWWWKKQWIEEEAKRRFEEAGREFMQATVTLAKKMRPDAVWGYYGFPYCFNMAADKKETCATNVPHENDGIPWLWQESTALYPSVYSSYELTVTQLVGLIRGRVKEAARVASRGAPVLPYFWYRYRDQGYLSESDLKAAISTMYKSNASGFIIWGSSNDVNTLDKCKNLRKYVDDVLGPAVAKYTKPNVRIGDELDETYNVVSRPNATTYDPEYTWIPPVNFTQHVKEMVDKEMKEKEEAAKVHKDEKESILVDMILHKIANYCADGCDSTSKEKPTDERDGGTTESRVVLVTEDPFKKISSTIGVTVPTTTEEDIYDYETNEYIDISTTSKKTSTTVKNDEEISTTTEKAEEITKNDISKEENGLFDLSKEESSTITSNIRTTESEGNNFIIEQNNTIDLSIEEISSTESSTTTISTTEPSLNEANTTESTSSLSTNDFSTVNQSTTDGGTTVELNSIESSSTTELSAIDNSTTDEPSVIYNRNPVEPSAVESSSTDEPSSIDNRIIIELNAVEVSTTIEPRTGSTTDEPSSIENRTTDEPSSIDNRIIVEPSAVEVSTTDESTTTDISTTLAPIMTEQVVVSVV